MNKFKETMNIVLSVSILRCQEEEEILETKLNDFFFFLTIELLRICDAHCDFLSVVSSISQT